MLAQELEQVLPDAVTHTGRVTMANGEVIDDLLVVNKDRIYLENVGAVQQLSKLTVCIHMPPKHWQVNNRRHVGLSYTRSTKENCNQK